jgi:hypothetical protein
MSGRAILRLKQKGIFQILAYIVNLPFADLTMNNNKADFRDL